MTNNTNDRCLCGEKSTEECASQCALDEVNSYITHEATIETDVVTLDGPFDFSGGWVTLPDLEPQITFPFDYNKSYEAVKDFHLAFNHPAPDKPTVIPVDVAIKRANWTVEELIEFLHASVGGDPIEFLLAVEKFDEAIENAVEKQLAEGDYKDKTDEEILMRQVDALTDISYFNYGSFVVAGVNPQPFFDIVQAANMGKLDRETGKPILREGDNKIMKPDYWEELYAPEPRLREELKRQMDQSNG